MGRRTKIVCTLGPAVDSEEKIAGLIRAGMNVARVNCSHGDWNERTRWIDWVRRNSPELAPTAVLVDLQGPKFRIADLPSPLSIHAGQELTLGVDGDIPIQQPEVLQSISIGSRILLGDGEIELHVLSAQGSTFRATSVSDGTARSREGITVVGTTFKCDILTPKDLHDIAAACKAGADYIALSYVHCASDMALLRKEIAKFSSEIRVCAKIETKAALDEIEEIVEQSDVVMVARGDLGLQMDIDEVPLAQKRIIRICRERGKPVITATQMLESMIHASRPTRAEATDVANAVLDGSDALMLSGETAIGEFPLEAVGYMSRIGEKAETLLKPNDALNQVCQKPGARVDHTEAVAHGVAQLCELLDPEAIVTSTTSGRTAILVSKYRPSRPILCATWSKKVQAQLAIVWGVEAALVALPRTTDEQIAGAVSAFVSHKRLKADDQVIVSAGIPPGTSGNTNLILVHRVT